MTAEVKRRLPVERRLTAEERHALALSAELANALALLRPVHPQELAENIVLVHGLQKSILARAAYARRSRL